MGMAKNEQTWLSAAIEALKRLSKERPKENSFSVHDILYRIKQDNLYKFRGKTPENTLNATLHQHWRQFRSYAVFEKVSEHKWRLCKSILESAMQELATQHNSGDDIPANLLAEKMKDLAKQRIPLEETDTRVYLDRVLYALQQHINGFKAMPNNIPREEVKRFERSISKFFNEWNRREVESVVFLGENNIGKSFLINTIARLTFAQSYPLWEEDEIPILEKHDLFLDLQESDVPQTEKDRLIDKLVYNYANDKLFDTIAKDERCKQAEKEVEKIFSNVWREGWGAALKGVVNKQLFENTPFLIPSRNDNRPTTAFPIFLIYGSVTALQVDYYSREELQDLTKEDSLDHEVRNKLRELFEEEDRLKNTGNHSNSPLFYIDTEGPHEVFMGRGKDIDVDRIYIRQKLLDIAQRPDIRYVIKRAKIYAPLSILIGGAQLVDLCGSNDTDPMRRKNLEIMIANARMIIVCGKSRPLSADQHTIDEIKKSKIINKMLFDPVRYGLAIIHLPEKDLSPSFEYMFNKKEMDNVKSLIADTTKVIKKLVKEAVDDTLKDQELQDAQGSSDEDEEDGEEMQMCQSYLENDGEAIVQRIDIFAIFPFLFASFLVQDKLDAKAMQETILEWEQKNPDATIRPKKDNESWESIFSQYLESTGGLQLLGSLVKMLYGRILKALDSFIESDMEKFIENWQSKWEPQLLVFPEDQPSTTDINQPTSDTFAKKVADSIKHRLVQLRDELRAMFQSVDANNNNNNNNNRNGPMPMEQDDNSDDDLGLIDLNKLPEENERLRSPPHSPLLSDATLTDTSTNGELDDIVKKRVPAKLSAGLHDIANTMLRILLDEYGLPLEDNRFLMAINYVWKRGFTNEINHQFAHPLRNAMQEIIDSDDTVAQDVHQSIQHLIDEHIASLSARLCTQEEIMRQIDAYKSIIVANSNRTEATAVRELDYDPNPTLHFFDELKKVNLELCNTRSRMLMLTNRAEASAELGRQFRARKQIFPEVITVSSNDRLCCLFTKCLFTKSKNPSSSSAAATTTTRKKRGKSSTDAAAAAAIGTILEEPGKDHWIMCDKCQFWYHFPCVGLEPGLDVSDLEWYCPKCPMMTPKKLGLDIPDVLQAAKFGAQKHFNCKNIEVKVLGSQYQIVYDATLREVLDGKELTSKTRFIITAECRWTERVQISSAAAASASATAPPAPKRPRRSNREMVKRRATVVIWVLRPHKSVTSMSKRGMTLEKCTIIQEGEEEDMHVNNNNNNNRISSSDKTTCASRK